MFLVHTFFKNKNRFYKNVEAEINQNIKNVLRTDSSGWGSTKIFLSQIKA